jgi:glycosyltransferase involved in cell wall biosynthesis
MYVHPCAGMGGAPISLLSLIEVLDRSRVLPQVLFVGKAGPEAALFHQRNVHCHFLPEVTTYPHARNAYIRLRSLRPWQVLTRAIQVLPSALRVRDFLHMHRPDLVHLNTSSLLPAALGAHWAGVPFVWHIREPLRRGAFGLRRYILRTAMKNWSSAIIAISRADAKTVGDSRNLHVVYNAVDLSRFNRSVSPSAFRSAEGIAEDRPIVAMLGGLHHSKGLDVLLRAAVTVRQRRSDVLFVVAGYGPTSDVSPRAMKRAIRRFLERIRFIQNRSLGVRRLIEKEKLQETVRFVGIRHDIPELLAASTLLVWPATVPHFSRPIMEAGAMGLPVVASDFSSAREQVEEGISGKLVPAGQPGVLGQAILELIETPGLAAKMGLRGIQLTRHRHDLQSHAMTIMNLYDTVMGRTLSGEVGQRQHTL